MTEDGRLTDSEERDQQLHTVPVIEEELVTGTRAVKAGSVRVRKEVERIPQHVEMPVLRDVVKVTRVAVNRVVSAMPANRQEGDTLIVPVVEEEIVVEKRLILKEEIHIQRGQVRERVSRDVELEREHATVERLDETGHVIASSEPVRSDVKPISFRNRRSLLD